MLLLLFAGRVGEFALTEEGYEAALGVAHLAHFELTKLLLPALLAVPPPRKSLGGDRRLHSEVAYDSAFNHSGACSNSDASSSRSSGSTSAAQILTFTSGMHHMGDSRRVFGRQGDWSSMIHDGRLAGTSTTLSSSTSSQGNADDIITSWRQPAVSTRSGNTAYLPKWALSLEAGYADAKLANAAFALELQVKLCSVLSTVWLEYLFGARLLIGE